MERGCAAARAVARRPFFSSLSLSLSCPRSSYVSRRNGSELALWFATYTSVSGGQRQGNWSGSRAKGGVIWPTLEALLFASLCTLCGSLLLCVFCQSILGEVRREEADIKSQAALLRPRTGAVLLPLNLTMAEQGWADAGLVGESTHARWLRWSTSTMVVSGTCIARSRGDLAPCFSAWIPTLETSAYSARAPDPEESR